MISAVFSSQVARSRSPHSHATIAGEFVFVSGIPGFDDDGRVRAGDFAHQMRCSLRNIAAILAEAGTSLSKVVKANVILDRQSDFEEMNAIYREFFGQDEKAWPARTTIIAGLPRPDFLLEIECVAMR